MKLSSSYALPVIVSVAMHLALLAAVTWGWQASSVSPRVYKPSYVEARLVQLKPKSAQNKKSAQKKKPKKVDLEARRREQARKAKLAEEKRRIDLEKKQKAQKEKEKAEKERLEKERLAELERQREQQHLEEQRRREQELESQFSEALDEEDEFLQAEDDEVKAQSYVALITSRIEQNWSRPPSARKGMTCELMLQLVPTGKVVNVSVVKGSGSAAFDRSAEQAVKKAQSFPELQGMPPQVFEHYFRQLRLVFNPKDLRL